VSVCPTRDVWTVIVDRISETLSGITLEQLVRMSREKENNLVTMNDI
jgi:DNA-binding IscR family transcriptional regulator